MAFYRNGKLVYDFEKDGKFYKKTKTREGEESLCQMVQCKCGGWASVKLVNTPTHMANKQHTKWAKQHGQKVVQRYKKKDESTTSAKHQQEKTASTIDTSTLFFNDQLYCSIREFDYDGDDIIYSWTPSENGLWINFTDLDIFVKKFYFIQNEQGFPEGDSEICGRDRWGVLCVHSKQIQTRGLIDILNLWGQFPKSPQECLFQLIQYHLLREFCLQSFNPQTKTFDESITNAVETSGCTDDESWKQIHQSIDDELKKSGIILR